MQLTMHLTYDEVNSCSLYTTMNTILVVQVSNYLLSCNSNYKISACLEKNSDFIKSILKSYFNCSHFYRLNSQVYFFGIENK